jgi:iron complex outermembrane receptor protein
MPKYIVAVLGCTVAAGLCASQAAAQSPAPQTLPPVEVQQKRQKPARAVKKPVAAPVEEAADHAQRHAEPPLSAAPASSTTIGSQSIAAAKPATNDTASLIANTPGVSLYQSGGVSSLPAIHGLADDRVRTELNGMLITSACGNHMNPVLSYIDPAAVKQVKVMAGITPVSAGGDSIGGTILVESAGPVFAGPGETITYGTTSVFARSNGGGIAASGSASAATDNFNITYTGAWSRSGDYKDGNGDTVKSTLYEAENHMLSLAVRGKDDLLTVQGGVQQIPYQGFVNARMDMTGNDAWFLNAHYTTRTDWGKLDLRAYFQDTRHEMDFLADGGKVMAYMSNNYMPMNTHGQNFGYSVKAEIPQSERDMLRVGNELRGFLLNDWWPPSTGGMQPLTFWNIHGGERIDLGTFAEWEKKWDRRWTTLLGVRSDVVWMNTGNVIGYKYGASDPSNMYTSDADNFNKLDRARTDVNFDATALARYEHDSWTTFEGGYAMKSRAPSLYERYAWSPHKMAMEMNGWFGDGNSYLGNIDLKSETAHTLSFTAGWHDSARKDWELKITPYYTYVDDYIDVDRCTACALKPYSSMKPYSAAAGFVALKFANHDAEMYGFDISGRMPLASSYEYGKFALAGVAGYVHSRNLDTGDNLYNIMPLNAKLALEHKLGNWSSTAELQLVDAKTDVQQVRNELQTPGYALVNLRSSYQWDQFRFDLGVENLFDQQYYSPLGGVYLGDGALVNPGLERTPVAGMGRTVYGGITVKF